MIQRMWAIALNTFREAVRIRVLYGILILVIGANFMSIIVGEMSAGDRARVARDIGIAGISLFGSLTAIFLGVFLLYTEVQRRTIHAIVSKPIERWEFVVGKYLGMALVLSVLVAVFTLAMVIMLALQHVAVSSAVIKAIVLSWFEVLTVAAVAIFFSSFSTPFLSGIFALAIWVIGRVTPDLERAAASSSALIQWTSKIALQIVPDFYLYSVSGRTVDAEHASVNSEFVSWAYVGLSSAYGLAWIVGLLILACVLFHRRDFV
jgi:ABC-type transport system involved in multi-copper enzyme maturation permease subunit